MGDMDNDGTTDPHNLADSIVGAAYYLAQNGYSTTLQKPSDIIIMRSLVC